MTKIWIHWLLILICCAVVVATKIYLQPLKSPSAYTYFVNPQKNLEHFTFGYRDLVADLLWLRVIQDMEVCDRPLQNAQCPQSWVYRMVDKVTDLSPRFRIVYATVPLILSLSVRDSDGAILLFEKSLKYFPNDWPILYRGGSLYLFDRDDKLKAAEYFTRAEKNGGPGWLVSLATRLYTEAGRGELAERLIQDYENSGFTPGMIKRMREHLLSGKNNKKDPITN